MLCEVRSTCEGGANAARGGTIQYGHEQEPPCLYGSWIQQWYLQRQFSDALVSQGAGGTFVPWLATSWTISDDKTVYTFEIKPDVRFTDGTPLDAQAIVDNFSTWMSVDPDRRNNAATLYIKDVFKSAQATGPLTVRVELSRPYQPLLTVLSQATLGILSPTATKRGARANCEQPVGSGPFVVEKWNHGQNVVFKRNPNYNSAPANARHQGPAYVDGLVWTFLRDPTSRYGSLQAGESDVIYDVPAVDWADAKQRFDVVQHLTGGTPQRLQLNTGIAPFDDIRVRQAFAMAANRKKAVEAVTRVPCRSPVTPCSARARPITGPTSPTATPSIPTGPTLRSGPDLPDSTAQATAISTSSSASTAAKHEVGTRTRRSALG